MTWLNRLPGPFHTSTKLFNAILQESWQDVLFELEMHPNHASHWEHVGFDGEHETKLFPLHQALKLNVPTEVILKLLEAYPEVLHRKDDYYQRLPLHIAAIAGCPPEVIRMLLTAYPLGTERQDIFGRVPLHYVVFRQYSIDTVDLLISVYSEGASVKDYNGWLPIHVACRYGVPENVLVSLLHAYPSGLNHATYQCERRPIDVALHFKALDAKCINILKNWDCPLDESAFHRCAP